MNFRNTVSKLQLGILLLLAYSISYGEEIHKIAFGSCANEGKKQAIWDAINKERPEVFVFLGDNIYGDTRDPQLLKAKYKQLQEQHGFQQLKSYASVYATWDDHDYGENDAGREYPMKEESRKIMLDFWGEPESSLRRTQEGGIYTSYYLGEGENIVQLLMLDLRWNRSELAKVNALEYVKRSAQNQGPYKKIEDPEAVFLGEEQWTWLEGELQKPAKIRVIASSLQLLADGTGWEAWSNFPAELNHLYELIKSHKVEGLFVISGDTHWTEISKVEDGLPYALYDFTSSGLTETWHKISPNKNRISEAYSVPNYGVINIDWQAKPINLQVEIKNKKGEVLIKKALSLEELSIKNLSG